ncbi:hypothetical protein [Pilimelia columellifera]|uniref:Uncharacterized protein n=1 Tax=Pilimelia columellifera subsp. columellifera TaxID=706583 RepID=A0ABP6AYM4_9ACTN
MSRSAVLPPSLFRRWVHVREEDAHGVLVYRPADHPIAPARGRDGLEFRPDGTLTVFSSGPVDSPVGRDGVWRAEPNGALALSHPGGGDERFQIVDIDQDQLRLRPA